jgi:Kef-type K+ transport system membrane component KefB
VDVLTTMAANLGPFAELALLLGITAIAGALAARLRQPVLIAYIAVGILAGPAVFGIVQSQEQVALLAQVGVAVLLFVVGLKLDLGNVRHIGRVALATGLGQLSFTVLFGFLLLLLLGKGTMEALYVAVALTFSSTIIVVKLLSDKRELDSLHGRIAVGFLIVQDIAVVLAMMAMSTLRGAEDAALGEVVLSLVLRIGSAAVLLYLLMRFVLPRLIRSMASSPELLVLFAIAWGTGLAALGEWAGFSKEAGAFLAGFSLASTDYREAMNARLTSVRDFLMLFFFLDLGARLDFSTLGDELVAAVVLSLFVLIGNPLVVMSIMGYMGYRKRTGFLAGLTVAQISEFSIVFVAMGVSLGHVGVEVVGLTTLVGVVTIALSTYMIIYSGRLFQWLSPYLSVFERDVPHRETEHERSDLESERPHIVVFGLGRFGQGLAELLQAAGLRVLGVDVDPEVVRDERGRRMEVRFGDAQDIDFVESLPLAGVPWVVSTLPDLESERALLHALETRGFEGSIAVVARDQASAQHERASQRVTVLYLYREAVERVGEQLRHRIMREREAT